VVREHITEKRWQVAIEAKELYIERRWMSRGKISEFVRRNIWWN